MRSEKGTVASLALSLPSLVRELNRAEPDRRRVPGLILQLAEAIFQPGQMLFYTTCADSREQSGRQVLRLISHQGLTEVPERLKCVPFGEGKIGWVADKRFDMLKEDWLNPTRTDGQTVETNHPTLEVDIVGPLIGPMINRQPHQERVLGVLCIGSPGVRPRDEKLMFQLVTNLGSLAMVNADFRNQLQEQAHRDGLTGLLNKRFFVDKVGNTIYQADRDAKPLSLFIFDIDHFKAYNDTNGHPAGDELLRSLAVLLKANLRPGDVCCRYGGEEFVVVMPDTDGNAALRAAERIRVAIENHVFPHQEKQPNGNLTISGGLSVMPRDGNSLDELAQHADDALYQSKRTGRNRVTRFRPVTIGEVDDDFEMLPGPAPTGMDRTE
jgi:diguanylate cyclase (GGDEF)-like protein